MKPSVLAPVLAALVLTIVGCGSNDPVVGNWSSSEVELKIRGDKRFNLALGQGTIGGTWTSTGGGVKLTVDTIDGKSKEEAFKMIEQNASEMSNIPGLGDEIKSIFNDQDMKLSDDKKTLTWIWGPREIVLTKTPS